MIGIYQYKADAFPISCHCGKTHDKTGWGSLHFVGIQECSDNGHRYFPFDLELRDCSCDSTLSVPIEEMHD